MKNAAPGSEAHSALMGALPPTTDGHRNLMCNAKAIEELLDLAVRVVRMLFWKYQGKYKINYPA